MRSNRIMIRTHCVHCGTQIETEFEIYRGKEFLSDHLLEKKDVFPDDPYAFIHLLCENCSKTRSFQDEVDKIKKIRANSVSRGNIP